MENATLPALRPPQQLMLRAQDEAFWPGIIEARARDEWTEPDLAVAVQLARCQADIEAAQKELDASGFTLTTDKGSTVTNPIVGILDTLKKSQMAMMRTLRMGGRVLGATDVLNIHRKVERAAKAAAQQVEEEDTGLIA